jgi:IMP and pyridine-specific 5'-nucleotidase
MGHDYKLHGVKEAGPGGWMTSTKYLKESPGNWNDDNITKLLDVAEQSLSQAQSELNMRGRVLWKKRSVSLIPLSMTSLIPREALDEAVLRVQSELGCELQLSLLFCPFNRIKMKSLKFLIKQRVGILNGMKQW